MDLLTIVHQDFTLSIECSKFGAIWDKAKKNIGEENLTSTYSWSDGVMSVLRNDEPIEKGQTAPAIFFDNADYPIWIDFDRKVEKAQWGSSLESENEKFNFRKNILAGFINYGNEVGRSEIQFSYQIGDETKRFTFSFEVLSTKLNYHEHWRKIIEDIESEYKMLSLDFMKRTFHGFTPDTDGESIDLIWWSVFQKEQDKFITACRSIIDRPRHRLHGREVYLRADKLKRVPSVIENEMAEHRMDCAHLYRVEEQIQSNDTQENRFLKYALQQILQKYDALKKRIETIKNYSAEQKEQMDKMLQTLKHLGCHPFFRTVGKFKGFNQESLILQRATGYSQVYRTWNMLRRAYSLNDGIYRLQSKDIATLYEIWCFIEVSHIVRDQLGLTQQDLDHQNRMEMNGIFTWELGKGEHSKILFKKDNVELAELMYNPKHTETDNDITGINNMVARTVPQKPDIVLQLTKNDLHQKMKMTYLFDAKYRISGKDSKGVDTPPDDAINQMHRYRDAIYYKEYESAPLKKEVIGGYILFPGDGNTTDIEVSKFYKTIEEVNIGAFPLRPKDERNRELLEHFIKELIEAKSVDTVSQVIPQKGAIVQVGNRVLIGVVPERNIHYQKFLDGTATLYYTGTEFPTDINLDNLHFFIPYVNGIRDVYQIVKIRTITSQEAKSLDPNDPKGKFLRIAFDLKFSRKLYANYQKLNLEKYSIFPKYFIDTTFDEQDDWTVMDKL
ncbi:MAG: DUF2357 domain-containing protein [Alphaproteobacteria bacterium]|nr:DUF2357 domain-containing protein [Alphaproteobacteria bacterium]